MTPGRLSDDGPTTLSVQLDRISFGLLLLLVSAVPLAFSPRFETYSIPKILLIQFLAPAAAAARIASLGLRRGQLQISTFGPPFLAFLGACLLSSVVSVSASAAWEGLAFWGSAFMVVETAAHHSRGPSRGWALVWAAVLSAGSAACVGLLQYLGVIELYSPFGHPISTLGNVTMCAALYVLAFPLSVDGVFCARRPSHRLLMVLAGLMMAGHTVVMGSRAGWIGLLAGGTLVSTARFRRGGLRWSRNGVLGVGAVLLLTAILAWNSEAGRRLDLHWRIMRHHLAEAVMMTDPASRQRLLLWEDTLKMGLDHLPIGVGPGGFEYGMPAYASEEARHIQASMERLTGRSRTWREAHNEYLEIFAEMGLPGLVAFGWLVWLVASTAGRRLGWRKETDVDVLPLIGASAGVLIALLHACFSPVLQNPASGTFFFLVTGLLAGAVPQRMSDDRRFPLWPSVAAASFLFLFPTTWLLGGVRGAAAHRLGLRAYGEGRMPEASRLLREAIAQRPSRAHASYLMLGQSERVQKRWFAAAHAFGRATEEHPHLAAAYHGLGLSLERIGQMEPAAGLLPGAQESYERALVLKPGNPDILNGLAVTLVEGGHSGPPLIP